MLDPIEDLSRRGAYLFQRVDLKDGKFCQVFGDPTLLQYRYLIRLGSGGYEEAKGYFTSEVDAMEAGLVQLLFGITLVADDTKEWPL